MGRLHVDRMVSAGKKNLKTIDTTEADVTAHVVGFLVKVADHLNGIKGLCCPRLICRGVIDLLTTKVHDGFVAEIVSEISDIIGGLDPAVWVL